MLSFEFCPKYHSPPFGQLVQLFFQDLKISLGLKILCKLYIVLCVYICILKNSLKLKLLAFWKKEAPLLTKNAPLANVPKSFGRALPPSFGQDLKECIFFQETNRPLHLKIGESTSELECGLNEQPAGHGKVSALQDDDAFNSYNIWINFKIINYSSWCAWYFIWPGFTTRCPLQYKVSVTPWNDLEAGGRQMSRWGKTWQAREKKKEARKWAPEQINR